MTTKSEIIKNLQGVAFDLSFVAASLEILSEWIDSNDRDYAYNIYNTTHCDDITPGETETPLELSQQILSRVQFLHFFILDLIKGKK